MKLREARLRKGYSQKNVADMLGVERTTYVKYETGAAEPTIRNLIRIADYFGVTLDYLADHETDTFFVTDEEKALIIGYRSKPGFRESVQVAARITGVLPDSQVKKA